VLDIACGLGEWLRVCMNAGSSIAGVDLSERAIEYRKKHMPEGSACVVLELDFDEWLARGAGS